ncbi:MAG: tRNA (cytidine(34)-2'-O)-methyltransferase [Alphaproteobacteria bacterium]
MRVALYQPDIPQNAGTILRMTACVDVAADVIGPAGFDMSDRALKRAGMDYLHRVSLTQYTSFNAFQEARAAQSGRLVLLTTSGELPYTDFLFRADDTLLVGRESAGVPENVHEAADARLIIPMQPGVRSLNVAIALAMVLGEALRQTGQFARLSSQR